MRVQARRRGTRTYYYLTQSYREATRVRKFEIYLGRSLPSGLEEQKRALQMELLTNRFRERLREVRRAHLVERARMPRSIREKELETFATRFTYDSNRIEGSSLTLRETALLLSDGITPSNRPLSDVREALAHQKVFLEALKQNSRLDLETLLKWHRDLFSETKPRIAGLVRSFQVRISGSRFQPPLPVELDRLLTEFFDWYKGGGRELHPVVLAGLVHLRLVTIHPFGDGNGRVTRLAMNVVLRQRGFPLLDIPYTARAGYYRALESSQVNRNETVFLRWFLRTYLSENSRRVPDPTKEARGRRVQGHP